MATTSDPVVLAVARTPEEAGHQARAAYCAPWQPSRRRLWALSAHVIRDGSMHIAGALLAGLSGPWGFAQGDGDLGGYHLVWLRDMVEAAGGLSATGDGDSVRRTHILGGYPGSRWALAAKHVGGGHPLLEWPADG